MLKFTYIGSGIILYAFFVSSANADFLSGLGAVNEAQRKLAQEDLEYEMRYLEIERQKIQIQRERQAIKQEKMTQDIAERQKIQRERQAIEQEKMSRDMAERQKREQQERTNQFWREVYQVIPNYNIISKEKGFNDWLNEIDPMTDILRSTYLDFAIGENNVRFVVAIINEFQIGLVLSPASSKIIASSDSAYFSELFRIQPNWKFIRNNPDFIKWLQYIDPKTGINYETYLDDAQKSRDVSRTERIFAAYLLAYNTPLPNINNPSERNSKQSTKKTQSRVKPAL